MKKFDVAIVGAGFTGLVTALDLAQAGKMVCVLEADDRPGGLAGTFRFSDGVEVEKFYHHWFNNDVHVPELVRDLGMDGDVLTHPSSTGMYLNGRIWKLSKPMDVLRFSALPLIDRIRLGLLVFQVQMISDWRKIEHLSIREWLEPLCGKTVYDVVWRPLIRSKFSVFEDDISAVWMWKKLVLRGGTRGKGGGEQLCYFRGGFGRLTEKLAQRVVELGGVIRYGTPVDGVETADNRVVSLRAGGERIEAREFLCTPSLTQIADVFEGAAPKDWVARLRRVRYLGNVCLILRLDRSLSGTYWMNVNDPGFPFVGVIEHTNFDSPENYRGSHIVYLSRYLSVEDPIWSYSDAEYLEFALPYLQTMFPYFDRSWIIDSAVWRSAYAQPVTEKHYSQYVPGRETPFDNVLISTMAQIYPEDRGTNYAIREAKDVSRTIKSRL